MSDERVLDEIVTNFLLNTCRLRPKLSQCAVQAAWLCAQIASQHPDDEPEADFIPLTTGSVAEFYIEPMIQHVGDIDVMHHLSTHCITLALSWQYQRDIHHRHSYQMSFTTMSRYLRLLTVTYLAMCTYHYVTY